MPTPNLILVGASTRAAAHSARRAGFQPWCADLFADLDLAAMAPVQRLPREVYPEGLISLVRDHAPPAPLLYTGGLENHPHVYLELNRHRPVWGYLHPAPLDGDSIRNPAFLHDVCQRAGLACPRWQPHAHDLAADGTWLLKPRRGSGGAGITPWLGQDLENASYSFFQQRIDGLSIAATFIADADGARLLGVTRQLVGEAWLHAPGPFAYSGSITFDSTHAIEDQLRHIGSSLQEADPYLCGLFGVDGVWSNGAFHVIEVNPRYTASLEVLEHATGRPFLLDHARAFRPASERPTAVNPQTASVGKAIYYAPGPRRFPSSPRFAAQLWGCPGFADVPSPGTVIETGEPVLTILARGPDVEHQLQHRAVELDRLLRLQIAHRPTPG